MVDKLGKVTVTETSPAKYNKDQTTTTYSGTAPNGTKYELVDHDTRGVDTETVIVGEHRIIAKDRKLTEFDGKLADQLTPEQVAQAKVLATDAHKALGYKNASFTDVAEPSGTKNPGTQSADQKLDSRQTQNR